MIPVQLYIALGCAAAGFYGGWSVSQWRADADKLAATEAAAKDFLRREKETYSAGDQHAKVEAKLTAKQADLAKEVDDEIAKPEPARQCLSSDGLRILNAAIAAANGASQPDAAVPAATKPEGWRFGRDPEVGGGDGDQLREVR